MTLIMKAVEFNKTSATFQKRYPGGPAQLVEAGWRVQPKYDGVFALAIIREEREDCSIVSRTGEAIRSCEHILNELHALVDTGPFAVIGELHMKGQPFNVISGMARLHRQAPDLSFMVHDYLPTTLTTAVPYKDRYDTLLARVGLRLGLGAKVKMVWDIQTSDVVQLAKDLVAEGGFDGAMIKDPNASYTIGECKLGQIVKVKPTLSLDLQVVDRLVAAGEKTGRDVYTLVVTYRGVHTTVGSGVPHNVNDVPRAGDIVEIECLGITPAGKLREPRFKGLRFDKVAPDA